MGDRKNGECSVCGAEATLKCSNCKCVYYCNKEHQRADWSLHKLACQAWRVCGSPELGRHLVATRDLAAGDLIVSEPPLAWGPAPHANRRVCVGCGRRCENGVARCNKCYWPACSFDCRGLVDKNIHGLECAILAKSMVVPRCDVLLAIRMLIFWRTKSKRWESLAKLQSHVESRGCGTDAYEEVQSVARHLELLLSELPGSKDILPKICGLIDVNSLETAPPEGSVAIYEIACLLEHSCLPNTRYSFSIDEKGRPRITVRAMTAIKKDEHLSTMYTHALWCTRVRREHLLTTKYFTCRCERCRDPTELGTHMGTLKCPCGDGLILPKSPLDSDSEWACDSCPGVLTSEEVMQLTDKLEEEVEAAMISPRKDVLSDLLSRLGALLHPGHQHCVFVGHSLLQLLSPSDPPKPELCKRIIQTTTVLDPHSGRLALYKAITLRELASCPGEDSKTLLSQAVSLLKFEPPNSPGEKLMKLIEAELSR